MISHHPNTELLTRFSDGSISTATGVAVSAHLAYCQQCRDRVAELETGLAESLLTDDFTATDDTGITIDIDALISNAVEQRPAEITRPAPVDATISVDERDIDIPAVLARVAAGINRWKHYRNGVSLANSPVDNINQCDFLYMRPGGTVPMHTHGGTEITLVLDGQFSDADGEYQAGDFVVRDATATHETSSEEGCLCFTVLEQPVIFKSGLARMLNVWNRLSFPGQTHL